MFDCRRTIRRLIHRLRIRLSVRRPDCLQTTIFHLALLAYDLTRGGRLFQFHSMGNINQQTFYAQDAITLKNLTFSPGIRFDNYDGVIVR